MYIALGQNRHRFYSVLVISAVIFAITELYSKHGSVILASRIPSSWIWDARSSPVVFAGTEWYYFFYGQYLYAKGPLTESCEIKVCNT